MNIIKNTDEMHKSHSLQSLIVGETQIIPEISNGKLKSIGSISINNTQLRNSNTRMLPWLDTFNGDLFDSFNVEDICVSDDTTRIITRAVSNTDYPFRERRDCSGDLCFRDISWDAIPCEAQLNICMSPAKAEIDSISFTGFKYWFEYQGIGLPVHRILDRQTWEVGGIADNFTLCLRNWLTPPRVPITRDEEYSTVGLDNWAKMLPGNLWARWSLLPAYDMQYGSAGVLLGWFDEVSLIRTVIEKRRGETSLRFMDLHLFEQSEIVKTNAKTILWSPNILDDVDALNLWTRLFDQEQDKACKQFNIPWEEPPAIVFAENCWNNIKFETSYNGLLDVAEEFSADYIFIDAVWEHETAYQENLDILLPREKQIGTIFNKHREISMCSTLDFQVADVMGGEEGLRKLCNRAQAKNIKVLSWMATHMSNATNLPNLHPELGHGINGIFAAKESGRHPDTGYVADCWTLNLNTPVYDYLKTQLLGVCERTGLGGFLWDSVSNLGWWPVDYSDGSMRPQFDKQAKLYGELVQAGLYILPEAIAAFSKHSCCGLHGGNIYANSDLGYSYKTQINLWYGEDDMNANFQNEILCGRQPVDVLFQCMAHQRVPTFAFHLIPKENWDIDNSTKIKQLFKLYKIIRKRMIYRTVLHNEDGVFWNDNSGMTLFFCFRDIMKKVSGKVIDMTSSTSLTDGMFQANHIYELSINKTDW